LSIPPLDKAPVNASGNFDNALAQSSCGFGDHELERPVCVAGQGGLRFESFRVAQGELQLQPFWTERIGRYVLVGV
jgi:hypothetical protein